jgi:Na+/alanine symporter
VLSVLIAFILLNYLTSQEAARNYKIESILETTEIQRKTIESVSMSGNSGFKINTSNPVLMVFNSIVATFFRPFIWEVNTPIALFSAIESTIFLLLTLNFFFKKRIAKYFQLIFSDPRMLMCFVFSIIFAIAIGASTGNFGALSRYKIPCMPFYFIMLLIVYQKASLPYPKWFNRILQRVI